MKRTFDRAAAAKADAKDFLHFQLWNPKDSGVMCRVKLLEISGVTQGVVIGISLPGDLLPSEPYPQPQGIDTEHDGNAAKGKAQIRLEGRPDHQNLGQLRNVRLHESMLYRSGPFTLLPDFGLSIRAHEKGTSLHVGFHWIEDEII